MPSSKTCKMELCSQTQGRRELVRKALQHSESSPTMCEMCKHGRISSERGIAQAEKMAKV